jgi:hypothetical protein
MPRGSANPGWILLALALLALCGSACDTVDPNPLTRKGPLPARSQMPLARLFPQMPLESAQVEAAHETVASASASYTSVFSQTGHGNSFAYEDAELLVADASARHGVGAGMELGIEIPVVYTTSGFLDSFVHHYHDTLGLPQGGRENEVNDQFQGVLVKDGETAWQLSEDRVGLGDIPLWWAAQLEDETDGLPAIKGKLLCELPTGSTSDGFGSGTFDFGAQLLIEKGFDRWVVYGSAAGFLPGTPRDFRSADVDVNAYYQLSAGTELRMSTAWSLQLQLDYLASPLRDFPASTASDNQLLISYGTAFDIGVDWTLSLFMIENLLGDSAPDFTVQAGISTRF